MQDVLGIERKVRAVQQQNPRAANQLSVMMELQADCFAGVWARWTADRQMISQSDVTSGLRAAAAVRRPYAEDVRGWSARWFTHGSCEQRVGWFTRGLKSGDPSRCNTLGARRDRQGQLLNMATFIRKIS